MDLLHIPVTSRRANNFDLPARPALRLMVEIVDPVALLRFIDAIEPSDEHAIPADLATIADALEAHIV